MAPKCGRGTSRGSGPIPAQVWPQSARGRSQSRTPVGSRGTTPRETTPQAPRTPEPPGDEDSEPYYPVVLSPVKQRQRFKESSIKTMSDAEVWEHDDEEIISASFAGARSPAYEHFDISLERLYDDKDQPKELVFIFSCKVDPDRHLPHRRPRLKTSAGTGNLTSGIKACDRRRGIATHSQASRSSNVVKITYSEAAHRAIIALHCARNQRPFNIVNDPMYKAEVDLLRPGTSVLTPEMLSRDTLLLHQELSRSVRDHFLKLNNGVHIVLDGWSAPIIAAYLGLVVVWYERGEIFRAVLEFIRLKQRHTGKYLAQQVHNCLKRFRLSDRLVSICMDNAANCNKLAEELPTLIPTFGGMNVRDPP
ncbi:hypothetical protein NP233_g2572 [Leucocoprinus birnbaumii]|uniref:Uncharacterized protein n=1 Tax=Leucocoprinus birnbaumii TaxID=56174 RepID=A0AAD5YTM1_9AGAR|nr:hypothetical protein NP233_g2572 [Leucocoprinus birnbaumii]